MVGLKQKELAHRIDVKESYLSSIENDKKEPSLSLLKRISKELDIPMSMLFWENTDTSQDDSNENRLKKILLELTREIHKPSVSQP